MTSNNRAGTAGSRGLPPEPVSRRMVRSRAFPVGTEQATGRRFSLADEGKPLAAIVVESMSSAHPGSTGLRI
jgi:hypothetical protein